MNHLHLSTTADFECGAPDRQVFLNTNRSHWEAEEIEMGWEDAAPSGVLLFDMFDDLKPVPFNSEQAVTSVLACVDILT